VLRALVVPPGSTLVFALAGLALAWRGRRLGFGLALAGLAATWVLATPLCARVLAAQLEQGQRPFDEATWAAVRSGPSAPGAIVVLGGGATVDGPPGAGRERLAPGSVQRSVAGARVARLTGLPVLVSGGTAPWLRGSEASMMRALLERDLSVAVRWAEDRSRDTAENAALSAALLRADGIASIVLVTHAYHMPRARAAFEAQGLAVVPAPHDWIGESRPGLDPRDLWPTARAAEHAWLALHELIGAAWYRLTGAS